MLETNNGDTELMSSKMLSFDIQTVSNDQKMSTNVTEQMEPSEDAENNRQTFTALSNIRDMNEPETASLTQVLDQSEIFEPKDEAIMERKKSTTSNDINTERKESTAISERTNVDSSNHLNGTEQYPVIRENEKSTINYETNSYYENTEESLIPHTVEAIGFQQIDYNTLYQQTTEQEQEQKQYAYSEPQIQNYDNVQNVNYTYGITPYQDYEQQQQQQQQNEAPVNYENYDQMNYLTTAYQSYDQQSIMSHDYAQQPIAMQDYDQQFTEIPDYDTSQYDQSQGCGYNSYNAYTSSYIPTANDQNYTSQTGSESYSGVVKKTSNDYDMQYNQQYTTENPAISIYPSDTYRPPVIPQYIAPLFPAVISSEVDPFSWEAQESAAVAAAATESAPQSVNQQLSQSLSAETYQQKEIPVESDSGVQNAEEMKRKLPLRPAPPSPSVERLKPPTRPPMPFSPNLKHSTESSLHQQSSSKLAESREEEEDAWAQFKKLTEKATIAVKSTEERLKELEKTTAAKDIKDESYLAQIGGSQAYIPEQAYKQAREQRTTTAPVKEKKMMKHRKSKKIPEPELTLAQEDDMDRAAMELAKKMAATRIDLQDWKPPTEQKDSSTPVHKSNEFSDEIQEPNNSTWTGFDDSEPAELPPSESGFFTTASAAPVSADKAFGDSMAVCGEVNDNLIDQEYDPFNVCSADELVKEAKARVAAVIAAEETKEDIDFFATKINEQKSDVSSPTQEGGSPASSRPLGFDDEFQVEDDAISTPSPLYDEDDSEPLTDFPIKFTGDGWEMMIRYPIKKKIMSDRYWKPCYVRLRDNTLFMFSSKTEQKPFMEILLQATYSLSDPTLQAYDVYGKIHTVKLQYVSYKERVGIRPGQISRLVEGHVTKYGLPLEHSAQCTVLLKFGSLNAAELFTFVSTIEDTLFRCVAVRNSTPQYKQDEIQIHCYDEYAAYVDKFNILSDQKARVRLYCLAFVSGSPILEIGLNDRRRQGKEIVRRKDILPMYTERWIRFENLEFHNTVEQEAFEKEQVIRLSPPDGCFFEVMRFRIRPPKNREKPLTVKCVMKIAGSKVEIRIEAMAAAQTEKTRGALSSKRQVPCEDIQIRFPVPEAWIYLFREERRWGVGSVHAKVRRPGKVKNLKDRLMGTVHNVDNSLIEAGIGEAKYEHVFRSLVWRIPRLPEKYHAAYREHLLRCRFELSSFDLMPETFTPTCDVEFTMPLAMISNTVVRSVSVEQHEDSDRVEKFVRYVAKCTYKVEIDYVQCSDLDMDAIFDPTVVDPTANQENIPESHKAMFNPDEVKELHGGYRIDFSDAEIGAKKHNGGEDSSSDDEEEENRRAMPMIQIDPKGYGY
ncbi:Adaptor complexes medium subunit family protein [Acanthocheilonema viteae]